jgi:hypothetical protein
MTTVQSLHRNAETVVDLLVDCGPLTKGQISEKLAWPVGRVENALRYARDELCPDLDLAIPSPTPGDGWRYQVTTEWQPVEAGASHQLGHVESRLRTIHRDVGLILPHVPKGSREWRRANFLNKHLTHMLGTLKEINDGEG